MDSKSQNSDSRYSYSTLQHLCFIWVPCPFLPPSCAHSFSMVGRTPQANKSLILPLTITTIAIVREWKLFIVPSKFINLKHKKKEWQIERQTENPITMQPDTGNTMYAMCMSRVCQLAMGARFVSWLEVVALLHWSTTLYGACCHPFAASNTDYQST